MSNNTDQRVKGKHEKNAERLQQSIAQKAAQQIIAQKAANDQKSSDPKSIKVIESSSQQKLNLLTVKTKSLQKRIPQSIK